ncbi:MAG: DNA repair protein RecO [Chloroflexi bacterium]|nr:DNA repair protein RecO [Chloroflexota bacterium]
MSRPRTYQTEAIIIRKTRLAEADRILTLYTPHLGKIQAVARGVRRPRSKMAGHLELLTHSLVSFASGRNLDTVTGSQTINSFMVLKSDLWLTSCALYAAEMTDQFTADATENYPLFQLLLDTMGRLCQGGNSDLALHYFQLHLLEAVGYRPQFQECITCRSPLEPVVNYFCSSSGGMLCPKCSRNQYLARQLSVNALKVLRFLQGNDFCVASKLKLNRELSQEIEMTLRDYVKYLLERSSKSAAWMDALRSQANELALSTQRSAVTD